MFIFIFKTKQKQKFLFYDLMLLFFQFFWTDLSTHQEIKYFDPEIT